MKKIFLIFWLTVLFPRFANADMSLEKYIELEQAAIDKQIGSPVVSMYLVAVLDSYGFANAMLEEKKQKPLFCQPPKLPLGAMNLRQIVNDRVKKNRSIMSKQDWKTYSTTASLAAESLFALQEVFPCN